MTRETARIPAQDPSAPSEETIRTLVHAFYAKVRTDEELGPVFDHAIANWAPHLEKMCDFWSSVMLMSGRFHGAPMPAHLGIQGQDGKGLNGRHFARWLHMFAETVAELCPPEAAKLFEQKSQMIAQSLQLGIAASRGEIPSLSQVALSR